MRRKPTIIFDFSGTLVAMRPAKLLADGSLLKNLAGIYNLGIITGARKSETLNILKKLTITDLFQIIITADNTHLKKPDANLFPKGKIIAYIGDTKRDEVFAKNGKVPFFRVNKKYNINQILKNILL